MNDRAIDPAGASAETPTSARIFAPAGLVIPEAVCDELEAAYRSPTRYYHTFAHAEDVARRVLEAHAATGFDRVDEAFVAALFHDAVYDVRAKDNEARSAELARAAIARHGLAVDPTRVSRLIERTAEHGRAVGLDADEALFLDCDMATLGGSDSEYAAYEAGVEAEYCASIPRFLYRVGRRRFLTALATSPRLFASPYFAERLEERARANIRRALAATD